MAVAMAVLSVSPSVLAQSLYMSPLRLDLSGQSIISFDTSRSFRGKGVGQRSQIQRHAFNLSGSSDGFIWKPWFSSLSLQFHSSFNYLSSDRRSSEEGGLHAQSDSWDVSNQLGAHLRLLPGSRMPFELSLGASQQVSDLGADTWRYNIKVKQQYSPLSRRSLRFDSSYGVAVDDSWTQQDFTFTVNDRFGLHALDGSFEWQDSQDTQVSGKDRSYSLEGNHSYDLAASDLSVTNFVSRIDSDTSAGSGVVVNQFYNTIRWLPAAYLKQLDYQGTSRVLNSELSSGVENSTFYQLVHTSTLRYRITPELQLSGGAGLFYADADGGAFSSDENVGFSYTPLEESRGLWLRRWSADGTVSLSQAESVNSESISGAVSQRFIREFERDGAGGARLDLSQGVSSNIYRDGFDPIYNLSHGASFYRNSFDDDFDSSWQFNASDSREINGSGAEVQLLSARYLHNSFAWGGGSLRADIDSEVFRRVDSDQTKTLGVSTETVIRYQKNAAFRVPRLTYSMEGRLEVLKNIKAAEGDSLNALLTWRFDNVLRWSWGLLSLSGALELSGTDEIADGLLRFEIRRQWRPFN
tara:strand:- start:747 stop:2489 length:1743 start_codon:yes stop_codon:yes gene_type:complete